MWRRRGCCLWRMAWLIRLLGDVERGGAGVGMGGLMGDMESAGAEVGMGNLMGGMGICFIFLRW